MNKNFEEEYRRMIDLEVPDLWDRIESRLPNQSPAIQAKEQPAPVRNFRHPRKNAALLVSAAAVLCLLLSLPGILRKESNYSTNNAGPANENFATHEEAPQIVNEPAAEEAVLGNAPDNFYEEGEDFSDETANCSPIKSDTSLYDPSINAVSNSAPAESEQTPSVPHAEFYILENIETAQGEMWYLAEMLSNGGNQILLRFPKKEEAELDPESFPVQSLDPGQICHLWYYPSEGDLPFPDSGTPYSNLPACIIFKIQLKNTDN